MLDKNITLESKRLHFRPLVQSDCNQTYLNWLEDVNRNQYLGNSMEQTVD